MSELGIVTHSHPYLPGASHSHTTLELQALNVLVSVIFTAIALGFMPVPRRMLLAVISQLVLSSGSLGHTQTCRIRGPTDFICN
ncbi:MAG: hypothetical protein K2K69_02140 [Muribaculaceae bacterium]|nr:hypothetical protein [Muribaculaceae bacterium]